jgi:predicted ArsR family transcriptional regulator
MSDSPRDLASEWETELESRTTVEKVYDVLLQLNDPLRVAEIADRAGVAPDTARKYLEFLGEMGVAKKMGNEPVTYGRNDSYLEWRNIDRLQREYTIEELNNRLSELSHTISSFQETYEAETPGEVVPQEHGYEKLDETMNDLRQWNTACEEVDRLVEALGHGTSNAQTGTAKVADMVRFFQRLQSGQPNSTADTRSENHS